MPTVEGPERGKAIGDVKPLPPDSTTIRRTSDWHNSAPTGVCSILLDEGDEFRDSGKVRRVVGMFSWDSGDCAAVRGIERDAARYPWR